MRSRGQRSRHNQTRYILKRQRQPQRRCVEIDLVDLCFSFDVAALQDSGKTATYAATDFTCCKAQTTAKLTYGMTALI